MWRRYELWGRVGYADSPDPESVFLAQARIDAAQIDGGATKLRHPRTKGIQAARTDGGPVLQGSDDAEESPSPTAVA